MRKVLKIAILILVAFILEVPVEALEKPYTPKKDKNTTNRRLIIRRAGAASEKFTSSLTNTTTYGNTTYSYILTYRPGGGYNNYIANSQEFNVDYKGQWDTSLFAVNWNWVTAQGQLGDPGIDLFKGRYQLKGRIPYGSKNLNSYSWPDDSDPFANQWVGNATGRSKVIVKYFAKQTATGLTRSAVYVLTVHDRFEVASRAAVRTISRNPKPLPGTQWYISRDPRGPAYKSDLTLGAERGGSTSLNIGLEGPAARFFGGEFGIGLGGSIDQNYNATGGTIVPQVTWGWGTYYLIADIYKRYAGTADEWSKTGNVVKGEPWAVEIPDQVSTGVYPAPLTYIGTGPPPPL